MSGDQLRPIPVPPEDRRLRWFAFSTRDGDDLGTWLAPGFKAALAAMVQAQGFADFAAYRAANPPPMVEITELAEPPKNVAIQ